MSVRRYSPSNMNGPFCQAASKLYCVDPSTDLSESPVSTKTGNFDALKAMTSSGGKLAALTGVNNPYPGRLGVIEKGALADIIIVDGNPLKDITVIGGNPKHLLPARSVPLPGRRRCSLRTVAPVR